MRVVVIEENVRQKILFLVARSGPLTVAPLGIARNPQHLSQCQAWITEALNVIQLAVPIPNNPYRQRVERIGQGSSKYPQHVGSIAEILQALLVDIDAGLLGDLANKIRAETFDNFLDHAVLYLQKGHEKEAGVIAGVVFEDTVRRIYRDKIGDDKDQHLENLINALANAGVITGQQSKQAKVASHIRTKASHAQWDEFDLEGVEDAIQITKLFLRKHLGG
jgi:hypothetical protein